MQMFYQSHLSGSIPGRGSCGVAELVCEADYSLELMKLYEPLVSKDGEGHRKRKSLREVRQMQSVDETTETMCNKKKSLALNIDLLIYNILRFNFPKYISTSAPT